MTDAKKTSGLPLPEAMAGNFQDAARWFNQMWAAGAEAAPGVRAAGPIPAMMMPTMDVKELEKRVADLRSVEHWLDLNLALLRTTIQGLELQRSTLLAWQGLGAAAAGGAAGAGASAAPATESANLQPPFQPAVWWNALQQQFAQMAAQATAQDAKPEMRPPPSAEKAPAGKSKS